MSAPEIDANTFRADVHYIESLWQRVTVGEVNLPLIDLGSRTADPLVFVPILEHLEFVYARQVRAFSQTRRVIMYRRREVHTQPAGLAERAEELRQVLDSLELERVDLVGHGDAAMVLFEFAERWPQRCRSLIIVAQAADYRIAPHPFIWLLHELFLRLPVEYFLPAWLLRRIVINYIVARKRGRATMMPATDTVLQPPCGGPPLPGSGVTQPPVCSLPRSLIEEQFRKIDRWPFVYKFSVLPIIHYFDIRQRLGSLTMPILLINRTDDVLSPEYKTRWLAEQLPYCIGYRVIPGGERFFMYAQAETVNAVIEQALTMVHEG
jgi:pimeloyl-ACP methyl ester carboxylesterase